MNLRFPQNAGYCLKSQEVLGTTSLKPTNTKLKMTRFNESLYSLQTQPHNVATKSLAFLFDTAIPKNHSVYCIFEASVDYLCVSDTNPLIHRRELNTVQLNGFSPSLSFHQTSNLGLVLIKVKVSRDRPRWPKEFR